MANTLTELVPAIKARTLAALRRKFVLPRYVQNAYSADAKAPGDTIDVPYVLPGTVGDVTPAATPPTPQNTEWAKKAITLNKHKKVDFHLTDAEIAKILPLPTHILPQLMDQKLDDLLAQINSDIFANYTGIYGYTGTAGTTPFATANDISDAKNLRAILNKQKAPVANRHAILDVDAEANASIQAPFRDASQSADGGVIRTGDIGYKMGFMWHWSHEVPSHTAGTITTGLKSKSATAYAVGVKTITATTAASTGACALLTGDIVTFAGDSQTYVLTADATQAAAATDVTLTFEPGLKVAIASATPGVTISVKATHVLNLGTDPNWCGFASRPTLVDGIARQVTSNFIDVIIDPQSGLAIALEISRQYHQTVWEMSLLYGSALIRAECASRLAG